MNKSAIRAFGLAIFLVGALLALASRFDINIGLPTEASSTKQEVEELQNKLQQANEKIVSLQAQLKTAQTTETSAANMAESANKPAAEVTTMTLQIYSGITPYIVAQKLEDGGIITNSVEMELLLANAKYARSLQIGSYEINSAMSLEDIANLITGKKQ
ncbi:hypothetical protein MHB42_12115 [Lysinibacillus sp. FSL K6-0232]|uniref:hypothetical protein n=1 Tax=unclassified Lysinibacillus TaxID=2636778 RepID=UPI0030F65DD1